MVTTNVIPWAERLRPYPQASWQLVLALLLVGSSGCAIPGLRQKADNGVPVASAKNPVVQVISLWRPSDGPGIDKVRTRGFAGQLMFLTAGSPVPAGVQGKVRILLYDDPSAETDSPKPIHQFDFEPEAWQLYRRETALGAVYDVFIPYVRRGNHAAYCRLQVCFMPEGGATFSSDIARLTLPASPGARPGEKPDQAVASVTQAPTAPQDAQAPASPLPAAAPNLTDQQPVHAAVQAVAQTRREAGVPRR